MLSVKSLINTSVVAGSVMASGVCGRQSNCVPVTLDCCGVKEQTVYITCSQSFWGGWEVFGAGEGKRVNDLVNVANLKMGGRVRQVRWLIG